MWGQEKTGPWPIGDAGRERIEQIIAEAQASVSAINEQANARIDEVSRAYREASGVPDGVPAVLHSDIFEYRITEDSGA